MTDLNSEGLEKAAEALALRSMTVPLTKGKRPPLLYMEDARAAVTAYLGHALPVVDGLPALWHLPDATILRDAEGVVWEIDSDDEDQWACVMGHEDGYPREDITLPALVIWWGDRGE